ncbi:MAG: MFS transporter [Tannerellaceae bacterium]|jgi:nucleoside transporter|nr:MFS transporter [Tannerellaceae bacterium]
MKNPQTVMFHLGIMMFMQYLLLAVWWVPMAAYLANTLKLEMHQVSLILSSMAVGSMASPFIGVMADRYVASEKVLAMLNLATGALLLLATQQTHFTGLLITVTLAMLCYMPSWSLTSAIAMRHAPASLFPRIRVLGSVGWVASGIFSQAAIHVFDVRVFDGTALPLYCGAAIGFVAAALNLLLPHTPAADDKKRRLSVKDLLGLNVISMLKERNFLLFMLISFLAVIPFNLYHLYGSMFLADMHVRYITVTMNWGQLAEIFFLVITTTVMLKFGIKKTLIFGLGAMLVRYVTFYLGVDSDQQAYYITGILVHGLIFGLFFVGGQVYTDQAAPGNMKAQAQGFLSFAVWGVGYLIGTLLNGYLIDVFRLGDTCNWKMLFAISTLSTCVLLALLALLFKDRAAGCGNKAAC